MTQTFPFPAPRSFLPLARGGARLPPAALAALMCLLAALLMSGCTTAQATPALKLVTMHTVEPEETLPEIARRHGLGYVEILAANPDVHPFVPEVGSRIVLPTVHLLPRAPREGITVNIADMRLYYWMPDGEVVTYPIGIGREELTTPPGATRIVRKVENPTWYPTPRMRRENPELPRVVPPGPDNPLGSHALYLDVGLLRIHGTNRPWGVGARASSGCVRLYPEDIPVLFDKVPLKTVVHIVDQEVKADWVDGGLYVEVHPAPDQADAIEFTRSFTPRLPERLKEIVAEVAAEQPDAIVDWDAVREAGMQRRGYPILVGITTRPADRPRGQMLLGAIY